MFIYYVMDDAGSAQDIHNYTEAARALGHEVVMYGPPNANPAFSWSLDIDSADALVFIFEWTTKLRYGDALDFIRLLDRAPAKRRIVIDCDGAYNDPLFLDGDYNHRSTASSRLWIDTCDSLSDRIYQPTLHPLRPNVGTFFFHAYDPGWEVPLDFRAKEYGMVYVGHSKFRWCPMSRILRAIEPIRERVGRIGLVGHGWDTVPPWAVSMQIEDYFYTDPVYLRKMGVEFVQPVPFAQVIGWMSKAIFSPVIYRPLFNQLRLVTCRTFETPAASTIPVFGLEASYVQEIYGEEAVELVLPDEHPEEKILDIVCRPERYAEIVMDIRRYLAEKHSYVVRFRELMEILAV
jgi:hypothetical protein